MKKNIEIIHADAPLLDWAVRTLRQANSSPAGAAELVQGLTSLAQGSCASLLLTPESDAPWQTEARAISCKGLSIYPSARRVVRDGQEISLTPKEFDILCFLARNRGEVFTKEQIYQAVWDEEYLLDDSNIMAFIRKIRKKIEPNPDAPQYILTIWGIGYKFSDAP